MRLRVEQEGGCSVIGVIENIVTGMEEMRDEHGVCMAVCLR